METIEIAEMIDEDLDLFNVRILSFKRGDIAIIDHMMRIVYADLVNRKNAVLESDAPEEDKLSVVESIYAELIKTEQKINAFKKRAEDLKNSVFDNPVDK